MAPFNRFDHWQVFDATGDRKYLTHGERARFLALADGQAPRWRTLCYVLAYTGCRISEALALTVHQVDTERGRLRFRTLKRRAVYFRTVPVPDTVIAMLLALPPAGDGRFWTMHRTTAWRHVKTMMRCSEISGPMASPKGLRHGFGIRAADSLVPPNLIQRWMGHASGITTAIYLDAVGTEERGFARRMW